MCQQFGGAGQVAIRVAGLAVTEVGRQPGKHRRDIEAGVVPADEGADRETVAKIMDPWPGWMASADAGCLNAAAEGETEVAVGSRCAVSGDEHVRATPCWQCLVANIHARFERFDGAGGDRHLPGTC